MAEEFKIAEAFIELTTRGDVTQPLQQQAAKADAIAKTTKKSAEDLAQTEKRFSDEREKRLRETIGLARTASGGMPLLGGAGDIATQLALGSKLGAGAAAVGFGMEGVSKASPATWEKLNYEADRLQAIIGRQFTPAVRLASKGLEKLGDLTGGTGAQLMAPQFSGFEAVRDRLQMEALAGMDDTNADLSGAGGLAGGVGGGWAGMKVGAKIGSRFGLLGTIVGGIGGGIAGSAAGTTAGNWVERQWEGSSAQDASHWTERQWEGSWAQSGYRSVMSVF